MCTVLCRRLLFIFSEHNPDGIHIDWNLVIEQTKGVVLFTIGTIGALFLVYTLGFLLTPNVWIFDASNFTGFVCKPLNITVEQERMGCFASRLLFGAIITLIVVLIGAGLSAIYPFFKIALKSEEEMYLLNGRNKSPVIENNAELDVIEYKAL